MKNKTVKSALAIILSIVMLFTTSFLVMASNFTEEERVYGNLCYETMTEVAKLVKLFYKAVGAEDLESMVVVAVAINNVFEPHGQVSASPSKRFDQLYDYMKSAADTATPIPYELSMAFHFGESSSLINAVQQMKEMEGYLINVADEISAMGEQSTTITSEPIAIKIMLNGTSIQFDQPPIIENGRTLVPLRVIFEALGATIDWNGDTQTVTAAKGDIIVSMQIGNNTMRRNNAEIVLDVSPQIVSGRILVPARAIAESFGVGVEWNDDMQTVILSAKPTGTSLKMYDAFPEVPDFGAITDAQLYRRERLNNELGNNTIYFYDQNVDEKRLSDYITIVKDNGFTIFDGYRTSSGQPVVRYRKADITLTIGVMTMASVVPLDDWGEYFCVIITR